MDEIIERLRRLSLNLKSNREVLGLEQLDKDIDEIEKVFDRETPKKPHEKYYQIKCGVDDIMNCIDYHDTMNFIDYHCPSCGKKVVSDIVNYKEYRHCYHCGQAIDWSGEDVD